MEDFSYQLDTKIYFGKDCLSSLKGVLKSYGNRVLLVYGGKSIHTTGLYPKIEEILQEFEIYEISGVKPNPSIEKVNEGVAICKNERIDVILAIGGGSVMDSAKAMTIGTYYEGDAWDLITQKVQATNGLPLVSIVTTAASGSELGSGAVISNYQTQEKIGLDSPYMKFKAVFMDPQYTFTVPKKQTAAGSIDILSHLLEQYFTSNNTMLANELIEAVMRTVIHYAPIAFNEPDNYEARGQLMWASSLANNGILSLGNEIPAFSCHGIEHEVSAYYNLVHGTGLAIITPKWLEYILNDKTVNAIARLGRKVFDIDALDDYIAAKETIAALNRFYLQLQSPTTFKEVNISDEYFEEIATKAVQNGYLNYAWVPLNEKDVINILKMCL